MCIYEFLNGPNGVNPPDFWSQREKSASQDLAPIYNFQNSKSQGSWKLLIGKSLPRFCVIACKLSQCFCVRCLFERCKSHSVVAFPVKHRVTAPGLENN